MKLKKIYRNYLRKYVDEIYLKQYSYARVLAENLINGYYVVLFIANIDSDNSSNSERIYMLVENTKKPILFELIELPHKELYVTMGKKNLRNNIPERLFIQLVKNGLYTDKDFGLANNDRRFSFHRLICCLYSNIFCYEVHHINKNKHSNDVTNLMPVSKPDHEILDHSNDYLERGKKMLKIYKDKIYKPERFILSSHDSLILKILTEKEKNVRIEEIIRLLKNKVKQTTVYKHLKNFFYRKDFIQALKNRDIKEISAFDEKLRRRWRKIIEFEGM